MRKVTTFTAAMFASTTAFAGEPAYVAPVTAVIAPVPAIVAPVNDWSGMYAGGQVGYGAAKFSDGAVVAESFAYGAHLGYNFDLGNIVLGAELDYNFTSMAFGADPDAGFRQLSHLKARVGYDMNSVLLYGVGGLAYTTFDSGVLTYSDTGYMVGLGADYRIGTNWTVGAEYQYNYFEEFNGSASDVQIQTLQARFSYNF